MVFGIGCFSSSRHPLGIHFAAGLGISVAVSWKGGTLWTTTAWWYTSRTCQGQQGGFSGASWYENSDLDEQVSMGTGWNHFKAVSLLSDVFILRFHLGNGFCFGMGVLSRSWCIALPPAKASQIMTARNVHHNDKNFAQTTSSYHIKAYSWGLSLKMRYTPIPLVNHIFHL